MTKTFTYPAKRTIRPEGTYKVDGGWKHTKDCNRVWQEECSAATDFRFCVEWEKAEAA